MDSKQNSDNKNIPYHTGPICSIWIVFHAENFKIGFSALILYIRWIALLNVWTRPEPFQSLSVPVRRARFLECLSVRPVGTRSPVCNLERLSGEVLPYGKCESRRSCSFNRHREEDHSASFWICNVFTSRTRINFIVAAFILLLPWYIECGLWNCEANLFLRIRDCWLYRYHVDGGTEPLSNFRLDHSQLVLV